LSMRRIASFVMSSKASRYHGIDDEIPMTNDEVRIFKSL
jgi:hypothetical protein